MTTDDWLSCMDPDAMLDQVGGLLDDRKRFLFSVACCRRIWHMLIDERSRTAIDVAERFADGRATDEELSFAVRRAYAAAQEVRSRRFPFFSSSFVGSGAYVVEDATVIAAYPMDSLIDPCRRIAEAALSPYLLTDRWATERLFQCDLLRDLFCFPFGSYSSIRSSCLSWNDSTVPRIAEAIYQERAFERLPILADALLDAGCDDEPLLSHLRGNVVHVRGCCALDLFLEKNLMKKPKWVAL
jgi:hypothetical protein